MSKLEVEQLSDLAGDHVGLVAGIVRGFAKAWADFNGVGTPAIRDSENISSLVDAGTGLYGLNYINAMANATYASMAVNGRTASSTIAVGAISPVIEAVKSTTGTGFGSLTGSGPAFADVEQNNLTVTGDLA